MVIATSQQAFGVAVAVVMILGWIGYLVLANVRSDRPRGSEVDFAPNRKPAEDDDELEGPKLEKSLSWGLILLAFTAIGLPLYWLNEPGRQAGAERGFDKRSVNRGAELFQSTSAKVPPGHIAAGCANCHGNKGQGGATSFSLSHPKDNTKILAQVQWKAPALNSVLLRFSDDEVRKILVYGRQGTPMPAWGVLGGGPLNDQQIDDLVAFLHSIQLTPKQAMKDPAQNLLGKDPRTLITGEQLFGGYCARCHTLGASYADSFQEPTAKAGGGSIGPNLRGGSEIEQFPDPEKQVEFIMEGSEYGKQYGRRGVGGDDSGGMPGFASMLTKEQIRTIVDYERGL